MLKDFCRKLLFGVSTGLLFGFVISLLGNLGVSTLINTTLVTLLILAVYFKFIEDLIYLFSALVGAISVIVFNQFFIVVLPFSFGISLLLELDNKNKYKGINGKKSFKLSMLKHR